MNQKNKTEMVAFRPVSNSYLAILLFAIIHCGSSVSVCLILLFVLLWRLGTRFATGSFAVLLQTVSSFLCEPRRDQWLMLPRLPNCGLVVCFPQRTSTRLCNKRSCRTKSCSWDRTRSNHLNEALSHIWLALTDGC